MDITHIVWDWNGTLFDDLDIGIECVNILLSRHGLEKVDKRRYHQVFGFPISDYYKRLGFDFDKTPYSELAKEYMDIYVPRSSNCGLRKNVQETVDTLRKRGYTNIILSASKQDILAQQIKNCGLKNIDSVYGIDNIQAAGKADIARRVRLDHPQACMLFVGDTPHDKVAADAAGATCVFVDGGHMSKNILAQYGDVLSGPRDVPAYVEMLHNRAT